MASYIATIALFIIHLFALDARGLGLFMLVVGIFMIVNQMVIAKWFIRRLGEKATLCVGLFLCIGGLILITLTRQFWLYVIYYYVLTRHFTRHANLLQPIAQHGGSRDMGEIMGYRTR